MRGLREATCSRSQALHQPAMGLRYLTFIAELGAGPERPAWAVLVGAEARWCPPEPGVSWGCQGGVRRGGHVVVAPPPPTTDLLDLLRMISELLRKPFTIFFETRVLLLRKELISWSWRPSACLIWGPALVVWLEGGDVLCGRTRGPCLSCPPYRCQGQHQRLLRPCPPWSPPQAFPK